MGNKTIIPSVIYLCVSKACMFQRIANRANLSGSSVRNDDNKAVLTKRIRVFEKETIPIIEYFKSKNLLVKINGE